MQMYTETKPFGLYKPLSLYLMSFLSTTIAHLLPWLEHKEEAKEISLLNNAKLIPRPEAGNPSYLNLNQYT